LLPFFTVYFVFSPPAFEWRGPQPEESWGAQQKAWPLLLPLVVQLVLVPQGRVVTPKVLPLV
jgi:hypothetical protein